MVDHLKDLHKEYSEVPIPEQLDLIVNRSLKQSLKERRKNG